MFFELIAALAAGVAGGGLAYLARRLSGGRLPAWLIPAAAGLCMIGVGIASEYGWESRARAALPEGAEVAMAVEARSAWRPWSYVVPAVDRFIAIDHAVTLTHPDQSALRAVDLIVMGRWAPTRRLRAVFDCDAGRRADLVEGAELGPDGTVINARWRETGRDDPVTSAACTKE